MTRAQRTPHQHNHETSVAWRSLTGAGAALAALVVITACSSSGGGNTGAGNTGGGNTGAGNTGGGNTVPSAAPRTSLPSSAASRPSGPAVVETNPPGDIPDNQAFVPYAGSGFTVRIPEGWARSSSGSVVVFSDKYNSISISAAPAAHAPTPATVRAGDLPKIRLASKGFVAGTVTTVQRRAGAAVLATYHAYSAVNPVTGKVANEAVERYTFWRAGRSVTLTLAAPVGSDNVDPWRKVTDSFAWTK
jgi:hypothetical protein